MEGMYDQIFKEVLPSVIKKITPDIFYWETSPSSSSNAVSTIGKGDIHFWRVWGAGTPVNEYENFTGRFNSEYGMQSMPDYSTILKFTAPEDRSPLSLIMRLHERHPKGDEYLPFYTFKYAGVSSDLRRFAYFSQVMQAYSLEMAVRSLRGNKPFTMGSLYWQLNDVWPVSSWSSVDYYGMYKASQYRIRQAHSQFLIHVKHSGLSGSIYALNDFKTARNVICEVKIYNFNGSVSYNQTFNRTIKAF